MMPDIKKTTLQLTLHETYPTGTVILKSAVSTSAQDAS